MKGYPLHKCHNELSLLLELQSQPSREGKGHKRLGRGGDGRPFTHFARIPSSQCSSLVPVTIQMKTVECDKTAGIKKFKRSGNFLSPPKG